VPAYQVGIFSEREIKMELAMKCLPVGALPYDNIKHTTAMMSKLFSKMPFIASLPNLSSGDTVTDWLFENTPGTIYKNGELKLKIGDEKYEKGIAELDKAFNNPDSGELDKFCFHAEFFEKYLQMIKKFNSPNACVNLLGPFTISQMITSTAKEQILADKSYRKLFIQSVCVKALWIIKQIKSVCSDTVPVIILEEPMLSQFGMLKRKDEDITSDLIISLFAKVVEKIKSTGAIVGVQCFEKCDWSLPIKAGVGLISFDAYNNPNNLSIIPELITDYLRKGGMINWGIVPVVSDSMVKGLNNDYLYKRLCSTIDGTFLSGVPAELLYKNALVSLNGNTDKLSVMFSEKANMLATHLGSRLASRF